MDLQLHGKVALVTGGANGIGEAITRAFAAEGATVAVVDRDAARAEALAAELTTVDCVVTAHPVELTDEAAVRATVAAILDRHGRLDCLVNNAGVNDWVGLRSPLADLRASVERNLWHVIVMVQSCLDALIATRGSITTIGTKCVTTGQGNTTGYVAAKGALHGLTREWALELAPQGVRVNTVVPAEVWTSLYERFVAQTSDPAATLERIKLTIPLGHRLTEPREIADTVVFTASPRSSHTTGQLLYVDGGYTHLDRACTGSET